MKKITQRLIPGDMIIWGVGWVDLVVQSGALESVVIVTSKSGETMIIDDYTTSALLFANATLVRCQQ